MLDYLGIGVVEQVNLVPDLLGIRDRLKGGYGILIILRKGVNGLPEMIFLDRPNIVEDSEGVVSIQSVCGFDRTYHYVRFKSRESALSIRHLNRLRLCENSFLFVQGLAHTTFPAQFDARYVFFEPRETKIKVALQIAINQLINNFPARMWRRVCAEHAIDYIYQDLYGNLAFAQNT